MALPFFLILTDGMDTEEQRRVALATVGYSAAMCLFVDVSGSQLLGFFAISIDDFRVSGGLALMVITFDMLTGYGNSAHTGTPAERAHQADAIQNLATTNRYWAIRCLGVTPVGRPARWDSPGEVYGVAAHIDAEN
ncbi:MAG: small neutral amino acid transporter SnatA (MarC family) [Myxococcota bacterium]|jgi:small neutral amino acid transporter SnatA (MarC family)